MDTKTYKSEEDQDKLITAVRNSLMVVASITTVMAIFYMQGL